MILSADISDKNILTEIALLSKAYWGYSSNLLKSWQDDLTVTSEMISTMNVFKFVVDKKIAGFYILNQPKNTSIELEFLFVNPNFIGKGIGKQLLTHAIEFAQKLNCKSVQVLSDPNAEKFYQYFGFNTINKKESSVKGRFLPVLKKTL